MARKTLALEIEGRDVVITNLQGRNSTNIKRFESTPLALSELESGGLDAVVFTAGIGEHAAPVRARVCELSGWLGVQLDAEANRENRTVLHAPQSQVRVFVIPTNEELMIAMHTRNVVSDASTSKRERNET